MNVVVVRGRWRAIWYASPRAKVVLPVPGGPTRRTSPWRGGALESELLPDGQDEQGLRHEAFADTVGNFDGVPRVGEDVAGELPPQ